MSRQDQFLITATYDGKPLGSFDKKTGGHPSAQDTKYRQGGMVPEISLGGPVSIDNITLSRLYDPSQKALLKSLSGLTGRARIVTTQQDLDSFGAPSGSPYTWTGTLIKVTFPDADSMSN